MGKAQKQSRRELIEKMQREQARADRRRTILIVTASLVVALAIVAYPAYRLIQDSRERNAAIADIGATPAAASCDSVVDDKASGSDDHQPDGAQIKYAVSPPSSGQHYQTWAPFGKKFYTAEDRPPIGELVHNLEHGYTILWYDETIAKDSKAVDEIERISKAKLPEAATGKFIAVPWKAGDGAAWPEGKHVAFSRWDGGGGVKENQKGHRQFCGGVSGEALKQFMEKFPAADAPEPGAA